MTAAELLPLAIRYLRMRFHDALIVPELSVGHWGSASLDVGAVTEDEIIGVEIKGEGDSPARLARQIWTYPLVATRMFLLPTPEIENRCRAHIPENWGVLRPTEGGGLRCGFGEWCAGGFDAGRLHLESPGAMAGALWADEVRRIACEALPAPEIIRLGKRPATSAIREALAEQVDVATMRRLVCKTIRNREWKPGKPMYRPGDELP